VSSRGVYATGCLLALWEGFAGPAVSFKLERVVCFVLKLGTLMEMCLSHLPSVVEMYQFH
jgi:hypothetical protein